VGQWGSHATRLRAEIHPPPPDPLAVPLETERLEDPAHARRISIHGLIAPLPHCPTATRSTRRTRQSGRHGSTFARRCRMVYIRRRSDPSPLPAPQGATPRVRSPGRKAPAPAVRTLCVDRGVRRLHRRPSRSARCVARLGLRRGGRRGPAASRPRVTRRRAARGGAAARRPGGGMAQQATRQALLGGRGDSCDRSARAGLSPYWRGIRSREPLRSRMGICALIVLENSSSLATHASLAAQGGWLETTVRGHGERNQPPRAPS
jgi:hypothetical protein